jgi:hypothetical protein
MTHQEVRRMKELLAKRKAHLIFGSVFLLALAFNIIIGFMKGETVPVAIGNGISAIKPIDYVMFAAFWYMCAVNRPKDDRDSTLISLNLSRIQNEK